MYRVCAIFALGQGGASGSSGSTASVIEALSSAVSNDPSAFVRSTAAHALGFIGRRVATGLAVENDDGMLVAVCDALCRRCLSTTLLSEFSPWQISASVPTGSSTDAWVDILSVCQPHVIATPPSEEGMKARGALVDFYEGSHGGSPADAYARSGMREHAAQSLCAIATVLGQRATTTALGAVTKECVGGTLVEKLSELVATESNRFTYGWAAEALRRLAPVHPAASVAFEAFLRGPRWKPPQMQLELGLGVFPEGQQQQAQAAYGSDPLFPTLYSSGGMAS